MAHQQQQSPGRADARASLGPAVGQIMEFPDGSRVYAALRSDTCRAIAGFILVSSHLCLAARCARGNVHGVSPSPFLTCVPFLSPADFDVDLSELLELNRNNYPTITENSALVQGSPLELPPSGGVRGIVGRKQVLKMKRRKWVDEQWVEVEVFAPSDAASARSEALLLFRSDGQHVVWRAGRIMSPAEFCQLAGNMDGHPSDCIIISSSRETLAQVEAGVRAQARLQKPRLSHLVARAAAAPESDIWVPEPGSFVTVFMQPASAADGLTAAPIPPLGKDGCQPQTVQSHQGQQESCETEEMTSIPWERALAQGVDEREGRKEEGVRLGILMRRESDGWYQVLLLDASGKPPQGSRVVRVRGYQILNLMREQKTAEDNACVEEWIRHLRRLIFILDGESAEGGQVEADEMKKTCLDRHRALFSSLREGIRHYETGGPGSTLSLPPNVVSSPASPPILCAFARSMDAQALVRSAGWIRKQSAGMSAANENLDAVAEKKGGLLQANDAGERSSRQNEDVPGQNTNPTRKQIEGEKEKSVEKERERSSKRVRTQSAEGKESERRTKRASTGAFKSKANTSESKKHARDEKIGADEEEQGTRMETDSPGLKDAEIAAPPRMQVRSTITNDSLLPDYIAQCLFHRNVVQTSISPICQTLVDEFSVRADHTCSAGENAEEDAVTGLGHGDANDEKVARKRLAELEEKATSLQKQLSQQTEKVFMQGKILHNIQKKQDVDIARASQQDKGVPSVPSESSPSREALSQALPLLAALREYVGPAAVGLQLRAARNLCHAANEARLLVAILLSEQAQLRQRSEALHRQTESTASGTETQSIGGSDAADCMHDAGTLVGGVPSSANVATADTPPGEQQSPDSGSFVDSNTIKPASIAAVKTSEKASDGSESQEIEQVTSQMEVNKGLVVEMKAAAQRLRSLSRAMIDSLPQNAPVMKDITAGATNSENTEHELYAIYCRTQRLAEEMLVMLPAEQFSNAALPANDVPGINERCVNTVSLGIGHKIRARQEGLESLPKASPRGRPGPKGHSVYAATAFSSSHASKKSSVSAARGDAAGISGAVKASAASQGSSSKTGTLKKCPQCHNSFPRSSYTESGWSGRGWCQNCRNGYSRQVADRRARPAQQDAAGKQVASEQAKTSSPSTGSGERSGGAGGWRPSLPAGLHTISRVKKRERVEDAPDDQGARTAASTPGSSQGGAEKNIDPVPDTNRARCKAHLRQGYMRVLRSYPDDLADELIRSVEGEAIGAGLHSMPTSGSVGLAGTGQLGTLLSSAQLAAPFSQEVPTIAQPPSIRPGTASFGAGGRDTALTSDSAAGQRSELSRKLAERRMASAR